MKSLFIFLLISFAFCNASAQVKAFAPLSCFTWGQDQFLDYETVQRLGPVYPTGPYVSRVVNYSADRYQSFGQDRRAYAWIVDSEPNAYINNIQVLRWILLDKETTYEFVVRNMFDEVLYSVSSENSCGVIIFPDSLQAAEKYVSIGIQPIGNTNRIDSRQEVMNFSRMSLRARSEEDRLAILKEIQACSSLECKMEKLKAHRATLDILSLLELEKMKDKQNKSIDKLYWEFVSQIRNEFSVRSWER